MTGLEAAGVGGDLEAEFLGKRPQPQKPTRSEHWLSIYSTRRRRSWCGEAMRATRSPITPTRTSRTWIRKWRKCSSNSLQVLRRSREHLVLVLISTGGCAMDRKMNRKMIDRALIGLMCFLLLQLTVQAGAVAPAGQSQGQSQDQSQNQSQDQSQAPAQQLSPQELQQLVAPIALYPDALVAQVLAASTYPTQIVEADRWM